MFVRKYIAQFNATLKSINLIWKITPKGLISIFTISFFVGISQPIMLYVYGLFINQLNLSLVTLEISYLVAIFILYYILQAFSNITSLLLNYVSEIQAQYIQKEITDSILSKSNRLMMKMFDDSEVYNNINMISNETYRVQNIIGNLITIFSSLISLFGIIGIVFFQYKLITLLSVVVFIPALLIGVNINKRMYKLYVSRLENMRLASALQALMLRYDNIKEIKIYKAGTYLRKIISDIYSGHITEDKKVKRKNTIQLSLANILENIIGAILKLYLLIDGIRGADLLGNLVMRISAIDYIMNNVRNIIKTLAAIMEDNIYITTTFNFLENKYDEESADGFVLSSFDKIVFQNVSFKYPKKANYVFEDINITFEKSKSYLIIGANGVGKTTLIKLLAGLYEPTNGKILIDNIPISDYSIASYHNLIGIVFQDYIKYPLTVEENIKIGNHSDFYNNEKMHEAARKVGVEQFVQKLQNKYHTILSNEWIDGTNLSQGQWQKLAISRAYFAQPLLMIMDEPTASLDAYAENKLYNNIAELMKESTTIMISHRYTTAKLVDEIIVLGEKGVIEKGTFEELMNKKGKFSEMFKLQAEKYGMH